MDYNNENYYVYVDSNRSYEHPRNFSGSAASVQRGEYPSMVIIIFGFIYPVLAVPTILGNILAIKVFLQRKMRSATTTLLVALAVTDTISICSALPYGIYMFTLGHYQQYVLYEWCIVDHSSNVMQTILRTMSNWLTVTLGIQRFVAVSFPFKAKTLLTIRKTIVTIVTCAMFSLMLHILLIGTMEIQRVPIPGTNGTADGCRKTFSQWFVGNFDVKQTLLAYNVLSGLFSRFLPCVILLITTIVLVYKLNTGRQRVRQSVKSSSFADDKTRKISSIVLIIMVIFLFAETQDAMAYGIYVYELTVDELRSVLSAEDDAKWAAIGSLFSLLSYLCNFWVYIVMSKQFRVAILNVLKSCCCCCCPSYSEQIASSSSLVNNGKGSTSYKLSKF